jgi:transposase
MTRSLAAPPKALAADDHRPSTLSATSDVTSSNAASTGLKQFRDLATRYAKRAAYYQAELTIAAIILWLR